MKITDQRIRRHEEKKIFQKKGRWKKEPQDRSSDLGGKAQAFQSLMRRNKKPNAKRRPQRWLGSRQLEGKRHRKRYAGKSPTKKTAVTYVEEKRLRRFLRREYQQYFGTRALSEVREARGQGKEVDWVRSEEFGRFENPHVRDRRQPKVDRNDNQRTAGPRTPQR